MTTTNPVKTLKTGSMTVAVYDSRTSMGAAAAIAVAAKLRQFLAEKEEVNILFPCAVSQLEFFDALFTQPGIAWERVNAFVMDEYLGLDKDHPGLLANFAQVNIFSRVSFKNGFAMNGTNPDFEGECERYAALLRKHPLDISCLGVGENGHLAYNEPGIADFNDPKLVKVVDTDPMSHIQAVRDGIFPNAGDVPRVAMTVTVPPMVNAAYISAVVPGPQKADAIYKTVHDVISTDCPSTILRNYECVLYTDVDGGGRI